MLRPGARPYARHLQRVLDLGGASLQRDLGRLVDFGILERTEDGRLARYHTGDRPNFWAAVRLLVADLDDPASLLSEALRDVSGIEAAFVFGSAAEGARCSDSDIDLFVVEQPGIDPRALHRQIAEAGHVLGREMNPVRYTQQALAERLGNANHAANGFVRAVIAGPKRWVAGSEAAIRPIATAAGLSLDNLSALPT